MISWRGIALGGVGALFYFILKDRTLLGAIIAEVLPALFIGLDWLITPGKEMFSLQRKGPVRYVIGRPNPIQLVIENKTRVPMRIAVRDDTPQTWIKRRPWITCDLPASDTARLTYNAVPPRRGSHTFGNIHLRVVGRLGLIVRQYSFDAQQVVKVLPDIRQIREEQLLARSARVRPSDRVRRILPGRGTEFSRVREYTVDDEFRHINWKATAKWGRPMVNEFEVTRNQTVMILIDAGRLSGTMVAGLTRLDHAINSAIRLAYTSVESGDRVGLIVFADRVLRTVAPDSGMRALQQIVQSLSDVEPQLVEADYPRAFSYAKHLEPRHSLICLFTDVIESWSSEELCHVIQKTSDDYLISLLTMPDPEVLHAAYAVPQNTKTLFSKAAALEICQNRRATLKKIERSGAVVVDAPSSELATASINTYLALKAKAAV